ncbi:MAG: amino acid adenylation domain-containing protein [bacterium]|nr:amino acid adenylation domain-containing protein [bacterium]
MKIADAVADHGVTHINFIPTMFNVFLEFLEHGDLHRLSALKYIFLAGEALLPGTVRKFRNLGLSCRLENIYGPTEASIYGSWYSMADWDGISGVPIGSPLDNVTLYIRDRRGKLSPPGAGGELCIGEAQASARGAQLLQQTGRRWQFGSSVIGLLMKGGGF